MDEESPQVESQEEPIDGLAKKAEGRGEFEAVDHAGVSAFLDEVVVVDHGLESARDEGVLKVGRAVKLCDADGKLLANAKVAGFPGDLVIEANETGGHAGDGSFFSG